MLQTFDSNDSFSYEAMHFDLIVAKQMEQFGEEKKQLQNLKLITSDQSVRFNKATHSHKSTSG